MAISEKLQKQLHIFKCCDRCTKELSLLKVCSDKHTHYFVHTVYPTNIHRSRVYTQVTQPWCQCTIIQQKQMGISGFTTLALLHQYINTTKQMGISGFHTLALLHQYINTAKTNGYIWLHNFSTFTSIHGSLDVHYSLSVNVHTVMMASN